MIKTIEVIRTEVDSIKDNCGMPIDSKIKELVIGLRANGITTEQSCEGHKNKGVPYPWVDIPKKEAVKLAELVARQNRPTLLNGEDNLNIWVLRPSCSIRLVPDDRTRSLEQMQQDAFEFGLFLQHLLEE